MKSKIGASRFAKAGIAVFVSICMVFASFGVSAIQSAKQAHAAENQTAVLQVTVATSVMEKKFDILIYPSSADPTRYLCKTRLDTNSRGIGIADYKEKAKVSVKNLRPDLVDSNSITYEKTIGPASYRYLSGSVSFKVIGATNTSEGHYMLEIQESPIASLQAATNASSKGFHPSKNNSIMLYALVKGDLTYYNFGNTKTRSTISFRILNSAGKAVYTKSWKNAFIYETCGIEWNGKASKGNAAKVKAGKYVKSGTYTYEVNLTCKRDGKVIAKLSGNTKFKVSYKAAKGVKGRAKAKVLPLYTGDAQVDYMAEKMLKAAGVKSSMSADRKVRKIYSYMTTRFKHNHGDKKFTVYYNLKKLKSKIAAYKKATDEKVAKGKAYYTHIFDGISWNMARRAGVCDHNAAVFMILCNHAGVQASKINGYYKNSDGSLAGHAWNSAVVNGKNYYYDVDIEIQNLGKGQGNYYWYKKTLAQSKKNHKYFS